jgi:hypothetical protein
LFLSPSCLKPQFSFSGKIYLISSELHLAEFIVSLRHATPLFVFQEAEFASRADDALQSSSLCILGSCEEEKPISYCTGYGANKVSGVDTIRAASRPAS